MTDQDLTQLPASEALALIRSAAAEGIKSAAPQSVAATTAEDRAIALDVLTAEVGRTTALEQLAVTADLTDLAPKIAAERKARADREEAQKAAAEANSPAGRRAAAQAVIDQEAQQAKEAELARALLGQDPHYDTDLLGRMTHAELVEAAGIVEQQVEEPPVTPRTPIQEEIARLDERWWNLADHERRSEAERLGVNFDEAQATKQNELENDPRYNQ